MEVSNYTGGIHFPHNDISCSLMVQILTSGNALDCAATSYANTIEYPDMGGSHRDQVQLFCNSLPTDSKV